MKFYRNQEIEDLAQNRLNELERLLDHPLYLPIPMDLIAENILGLNILWEPIEEHPGETVFGGLIPKRRLMVLNERRRTDFEKKPGLERSTKGHEMGHWDLFVDKTLLDHPKLFDDDEQAFAFRNSPIGSVEIITKLFNTPEGMELLRKINARSDSPSEARAVNRYAAALSMPLKIIREEALKINRTQWPDLYRLAKMFEVTITALRVRLEQLGLLYVDKEGRLYESQDTANGQIAFKF